MLRSEVSERLKNLKSIQKELRPEILNFLKKEPDEMFSMEEILDDLNLTEDGISGGWCSSLFGPDVYCAHLEDISYCADLIIGKLVARRLVEKITIGKKAYYGLSPASRRR